MCLSFQAHNSHHYIAAQITGGDSVRPTGAAAPASTTATTVRQSKHRGLSWSVEQGQWEVKVLTKLVGYFHDEDDAARAYNLEARRRFDRPALNDVVEPGLLSAAAETGAAGGDAAGADAGARAGAGAGGGCGPQAGGAHVGGVLSGIGGAGCGAIAGSVPGGGILGVGGGTSRLVSAPGGRMQTTTATQHESYELALTPRGGLATTGGGGGDGGVGGGGCRLSLWTPVIVEHTVDENSPLRDALVTGWQVARGDSLLDDDYGGGWRRGSTEKKRHRHRVPTRSRR